LYNYLIGF